MKQETSDKTKHNSSPDSENIELCDTDKIA